ncbi:hypothetical protein [Leptospira adleri]|uniref:Uncharacterized protein n=1 Tax=Leptospira adleri TaxID=2023186 RepID=A0ABX4NY69_9LEPT|nr:hypothetical protein [Leptospira adleri]PJZ60790.1 hypothetical protein CH376_16495 [Leptospira adleri]
MEKKKSKPKVEGRTKAKFKFTANDFKELLKKQDRKCALTGRELTALTVEVELREPYKIEGIESLENHYLVDRSISFLARHVSEKDIIDVAAEIIQLRGLERGYKLSVTKGKKGLK